MISCPPLEALCRLLEGVLPEGPATEIRDHLEGCRTCLEAIDRLTDDPDLDSWIEAGLGSSSGPTRRTALEGSDRGRSAVEGMARTVGPYDIEAEIGRGGMGIVYRARDRTIGRVVALKVLRPDHDNDRARRRFLREVRAAARVEHDHLIRVYATSEPGDPIPYFSMELLGGGSLAGRLRAGGRLDPREAAEVVAQATEGLAAAHQAGLAHRDIKPDNILFDPATGRVKLGDFGLARLEAESSDLTVDGVVAGTPHYLSPESIRGTLEVGPPADVYAMGVTLYECLAGEVPYRGAPHLVVQQILHDDPRPPRALNDAVPRDLETICLKAMDRDPARRYASAEEMAEDLRRWLRGEPIRARPAGPIGRAWRLARRRPLASSLIAALAVALVLGASTAAVLWRKAEASATEARGHLLDAERNYRQARDAVDTFYSKLIADGTLNKPGLESVRLEVIRAALGHYRAFLERRDDDLALRADMAEGQIRAGFLLGEVGDKREALRAIQVASGTLESLAGDRPGDVEVRRRLGRCLDEAAYMLQQLGRMPEALAGRRRACDVYRRLVESDPGDSLSRRHLAHGLGNLANTYLQGGQTEEGRKSYLLARAQIEALLRVEPNSLAYRADLAVTLNNLAMTSSPRESIGFYREALALRRALAEQQPGSPWARRNLAMTLYNLSLAEGGPARSAAVLPLLDEACGAFAEVVARADGRLSFRDELARARALRANALVEAGRASEALVEAERSLAILEEITRVDPENVVFRVDLEQAHLARALALEALERRGEALLARRARLALLERNVGEHPGEPGPLAEASVERRAIAELSARIGPESARPLP